MKRLLLAAAVALLAVAAPVQAGGYYYIPTYIYVPPATPTADPGSYEKIHKVGVVSALGSKFTISGRSEKAPPVDISPWQVDAQVAALLKKYLGGRFEFVDVAADTGAAPALSRNLFGETKTLAYLKTLPNPGVDAYIVVRPVAGDLPGPDGLGVQVGDRRPALWANFEIDIVDAHTNRIIAKAASRIQTREEQDPIYAVLDIDDVPARDLEGTLTAEEMDTLHRYLNELLPTAMVETLRALQLGVTLPPIGDHSITEPAVAHDTASIHSVAVISAIGDKFLLVKGGHVFIKRWNVAIPSASWGIDEEAEAIARDVLVRHYTVKPVTADRAALAQVQVVADAPIPPMPGLQVSADVDAYVLLLKVGGGWNFAKLQTGLGLFHWLPAGNEMTAVYANYAVVVIDAHTLKPIVGTAAIPSPKKLCTELKSFWVGPPHCAIDDKLAPEPPDRLNAESEAAVRDTLRTLLTATIPETLFHAGLNAPQSPQAAAARN